MKDETVERVEGPTPAGGAYALVYYQAADGSPVEKSKAVRAEAIEFNQDDKPISVAFLDFSVPSDDEDE